MVRFSKSGKDRLKKGATDRVENESTSPGLGIDTPSRLGLGRQELARITEQKIDEIESAIKEDYLKSVKAAKEEAAMKPPSLAQEEKLYGIESAMQEGTTILPNTVPLQNSADDFHPTILVNTGSRYSLLNDDTDL